MGVEIRCPACGQASHFLPRPRHNLPHVRSLQSLHLVDYIKAGWDLFRDYPYGFISFCLLNILIHALIYGIPTINWLILAAITSPLMMGNFIVAAKLLHGQNPRFKDFFLGFSFFWPLMLVSLISLVLIGIGMILLIVPGIYLMVAYLFAPCLVVDRSLDFWRAMELSRRTVTPLWFGFFAFMLFLSVINLAGALLLGMGLLATIPITLCALTVAYGDLFGFQSDYTRGSLKLKTF